MFITIVFGFLIAAIAINRQTFSRKDPVQSKAIENTILLSLSFFGLWLIVDYFFIAGQWWSLSTEYVFPAILLASSLAILNIFLYSWYMNGTDYKSLYDAGVISDGCPYVGGWSIPSNFVTHGAQVLWEEVLFRGFFGILLYFWFGVIPAVLVPTVLFGLLHYLPFRTFSLKNRIKPDRYVLGALISTTIFPAAFMISTIIFQSLVPAWIMHTFLNCSVGLYLRYIRPSMIRTSHAR
jgi:Type II CAAX prenyl endopeptidase Rce1-like